MRKSAMREEVARLMHELKVKPHLWGMTKNSEKLCVEALNGTERLAIDLPDGLSAWEFNARMAVLQRFVMR